MPFLWRLITSRGIRFRIFVEAKVFSSEYQFWSPQSFLSNEYRSIFHRGYSGRGVKLTTNLQVALMSRIHLQLSYGAGSLGIPSDRCANWIQPHSTPINKEEKPQTFKQPSDNQLQRCLKKSITIVIQMLLCGECYENVYT
jgi:hypothetical protein